MSGQNTATLRLLDKADKEIMALPRAVKGAIYDFQHKFRLDPNTPGLHLKRLQESRLFSARVNHDYRALLLHITGNDYVLVGIKHRSESYERLERYSYQINPVSGGIEFVDLTSMPGSLVPSVHPTGPDQAVPRSGGPEPAGPEPLFAAFTDERLLELGVAAPLLPLIAKITSEDELNGLLTYAPQLTGEVLYELHTGVHPDDVLEHVTRPVRAAEPVDAEDYHSALNRPATQVTTADTALQAVLEDNFAHWKVYLHPVQRQLVERHYNGPARVSGGPGTGKTIVALHRVRHLVRRAGPGARVLLTTFTTNLAADLRDRLMELGGPQLVERVDILNIDKLATQLVAESSAGARRGMLDDTKAVGQWRDMLTELGETGWDAEFLNDEWAQVILGQAIDSRMEYFRARRAGRGRKIGRAQRAEIWQLVERFTKRLDEQGLWTFRQVAEYAARLELERAGTGAYRYRHIVVDEAQDLSAAHWKMLRAMAPQAPDDLFIAGDTHQRIYDNQVALGSLGVHIRGRSAKLTLSYRTTHEILGTALGLLGTQTWDDLDDSTDELAGYRSVLRGPAPVLRANTDWPAELDAIAEQVAAWRDGTAPSIAVCVPERWMLAQVRERLDREQIATVELRSTGPSRYDAVHVGTMHRFKGLEYQRMIIAGVGADRVPPPYLDRYRTSDPARYAREHKRYRSLLFVAATRARDTLLITWHGAPSPYLPT